MNYTLYIDESGDFESKHGQWIVSGLLIALKLDECEKRLFEIFKELPKKFNHNSIKDFHLTEFRQDLGHHDAVEIAKATLSTLDKLKLPYTCLVTINFSKTSVSDKENTYRLMLADLLALCETTIDESNNIDSLDLVVASRTINGIRQTNVSNITQETLKSLTTAFEVGLATRGIVELIGNRINVQMDYANNSWGLVCADFIANLTYHNQHASEKQYLKQLESEGKYKQFESFGSYELRRARIAERDNDYVTALYRWLLLPKKDTSLAYAAINRILNKIFNTKATSQQQASIEALLERLWRKHSSPDKYPVFVEIIAHFESLLDNFLHQENHHRYQHLIFRVRNMLLMAKNHLGDVKSVEYYTNKQNTIINDLASNPEFFQLILDFKLHEIEIDINNMQFIQALDRAEKYYSLVQSYKAVWELLIEAQATGFNSSRTAIKAEMSLCRCHILVDNNMESLSIDIHQRLDSVMQHVHSKSDISRLHNYKIMCFLKNKQPDIAVDYCQKIHQLSRPMDLFDLFWFLRSINDFILCGQTLSPELEKIVDYQIKNNNLDLKGHPIDLIWREISLFEIYRQNKSKALKALEKSKRASTMKDSPISDFLSNLLTLHTDYINLTLERAYIYNKRIVSPY